MRGIESVGSREGHVAAKNAEVIPANAGTHAAAGAGRELGPCFRRDDTQFGAMLVRRIHPAGAGQGEMRGPSEARGRRKELFTLTPESPRATRWIACATPSGPLPLKPALGVEVDGPIKKKRWRGGWLELCVASGHG